MNCRTVSALLLILLGCSAGACGGASQKAQGDLKDAVIMLNEGVRWGRLQEVIPRVHSDNVAHFMEMHKEFGTEIQLSDYELINSVYNADNKTAAVTVRITWYRQSEMEVHATVLLQSWQLHGADWLLMTETYQSGEAF